MRRGLRWALAGLGGALLLFACAFVLWPRPVQGTRFTWQDYQLLKQDMALADVEAALGPAGDHRTALWPDTGAGDAWQGEGQAVTTRVWQGDRGRIDVWFDSLDRVVGASFAECDQIAAGPLGQLVWQIKRQWHRWFPEK